MAVADTYEGKRNSATDSVFVKYMSIYSVISLLLLTAQVTMAQFRMTAGSSALHQAIAERWEESGLDSLLASGQDINARDSAGVTPLHLAALANDIPRIKWLLVHGANPNAQDTSGWTPLHFAWGERPFSSYFFCPVGEFTPYKIRYDEPWSNRIVDTVLTSYAARDLPRAATFKLLLSSGADANLSDRFGFTALHFVNANPRYSKFSATLLSRVTSSDLVDSGGGTILMNLASDSTYFDLVSQILARSKYRDIADHTGRTALFYAVRSGSIRMAQMFLNAGADINSNSKPIYGAVASRSPEMVRFVLDNGADPNPAMPYNQTLARALKYESDYKSQAIRQLLLSRGGSDTPRH